MHSRYFLASLALSLGLAGVVFYGLPLEVAEFDSGPAVTVSTQAPAPPSPPAAPPAPAKPAPKPAPLPTPSAEDGPPFAPDLGGEAVAKVLSPAASANLTALPLPAEVATAGPLAHSLPNSLLGLESSRKPRYVLPRVLTTHVAELKLKAPPERVPFALTAWAGDAPVKPVLPARPGIKAKAADVRVPPAPPILARPPVDRPTADDPTAEAGNEAIVNRPQLVQLLAAAFVRVNLPDPFMLAEQIRAKLGPEAEPGLTPVPVNPRRPK